MSSIDWDKADITLSDFHTRIYQREMYSMSVKWSEMVKAMKYNKDPLYKWKKYQPDFIEEKEMML